MQRFRKNIVTINQVRNSLPLNLKMELHIIAKKNLGYIKLP